MRVLVVEEIREAMAPVVSALQQRGHEVTSCADASAALAMQAASPFPLVVVSWRGVDDEGLSTCRALREFPGGTSPVILVATDQTKHDHLIQGIEAGADDYLSLPITVEQLATRIAIAERVVIERARRELTEDALLSSEASFRALIEGSPDAIVTYRRGRIVYVNPALLSALGYETGAQLVGRRFLELVHPDDAEAASERVDSLLHSGQPTPPREIRLRTRDGGNAVMEEIGIPLEFDGEPAVAAVLRDLTERKQMEQRLAVADRMVSVGTLAAGIAHEINNPLTYVLTNLSFIAEELGRLGPLIPATPMTALRELLAQANDGAERVRVIVGDLKTFSRAEDGGDCTADVHAVIESAISMAWNEIRHRAKFERDYGDLPAVRGGGAKLGQVFLNLLINAAQSVPVGQATENRITVRTWTESSWAHIELTDSGGGIPEEVQHRIFDPFFTTKPVGVGVGLGLPICHNIIQEVGGDIQFRSRAGFGTTFTVKLPVAVQPKVVNATSATVPNQTRQASGARVLIVDDEPSVARALQRCLRKHDVTVVLSGRQAIQLLEKSEPFDVVFCDLMMSEMTGMELYEQVRQKSEHGAARFIFMTGGAFTEQAREFVASTTNPVIEKPFNIVEVQELVSKRRNAPAAGEVPATA